MDLILLKNLIGIEKKGSERSCSESTIFSVFVIGDYTECSIRRYQPRYLKYGNLMLILNWILMAVHVIYSSP